MAEDRKLNSFDLEAVRILDGFLPGKIYDAHGHSEDFGAYLKDMRVFLGDEREIRLNMIPMPSEAMADAVSGKATERLDASTLLVRDELGAHRELTGEVMTAPGDTKDDIPERIKNAGGLKKDGGGVVGLKPYHLLSVKKPTFDADIGEYLPESAWEVADQYKMAVSLHIVKDRALSDRENLAYIKEHAKRYRNTKLILAHAARSFAPWTAIEAIDEIKSFDNILYDFSGICESPAMFMIIKKAGIGKCMWGSDYPVCMLAGKAVSIADSFYWISAKDINGFESKTEIHSWLVGTESLMAVRQAAILADLKESDIERLFFGNAAFYFGI